jgi:CheY-like chemotaxis protein
MRRPSVLVVEDEALIAMMLQDWLEKIGCETLGPAASAQAALDLLAAAEVDAAILDLSLQGESSYPVAATLRRRQIPFAFATGFGTEGIATEFRDVVIVAKPYGLDAVRTAIEQLLASRVDRSQVR